MESSGGLEHIKTGTKVEMVCVAKNDLRLYVFLEVTVVYTFDRTYSADRHEYRGLYLTMISGYHTAACGTVGVIMCLDKLHPYIFNLQRYELLVKNDYICLIV